MQIPYLNLAPLYERIQSEVEPKIVNLLRSGQYVMGPPIQSCEAAMRDYVGVDHAYMVSNGTIALQMALMACDVQPGDEVIVPGFSFFSTAEVVTTLGAKPIFVDIEEATYNIDVSLVEEKITAKTKAIMFVSLYGQMPDVDALTSMAEKHDVFLIEDGAQSFGASYKGRKSGSVGHIGCTSFFPAKPLGAAGDGGAVFTNHPCLGEKLEALRVHGQTGRYHHEFIGVNGRLDPIQCVVLEEKLKHYDRDIQERQEIAHEYNKAFSSLSDVVTPVEVENTSSVFAQYTLRVKDRETFAKQLGDKGVPTSVHYPSGMHEQPIYKKLFGDHLPKLPLTEKLSKEVISLPLYPLMPKEHVQKVIESVVTSSSV